MQNLKEILSAIEKVDLVCPDNDEDIIKPDARSIKVVKRFFKLFYKYKKYYSKINIDYIPMCYDGGISILMSSKEDSEYRGVIDVYNINEEEAEDDQIVWVCSCKEGTVCDYCTYEEFDERGVMDIFYRFLESERGKKL